MSILPDLERELLTAFDRGHAAPASRRVPRVRPAWASPSAWLGRAALLASVLVALAVGGVALVALRHAPSAASSSSAGGAASNGLSPAAASVAQLKRGKWSALPPAPIAPRSGASVVWTGHELIVWGGSSADGADLYRNGAAYVPSTGIWHRIAPAPISARESAAAVWDGHEMIVWGGNRGRPRETASGGAAYNPTTNTWRRLPAAPISAGWSPDAVWTGDAMIVLDGNPEVGIRDADEPAAAAEYDPTTNRWTYIEPPTPPGRHGINWATVAQAGGRLFAFSDWLVTRRTGCCSGNARGGTDLFVLDERTDRWRDVSTGADAVLGSGSAFSTGSGVLVRGTPFFACAACSELSETEVSAVFRLATGTWRTLPADPIGELDPVSTWTGRALFSLNEGSDTFTPGRRGEILPGDATAYSPATNRWTRLPRSPYRCDADSAEAPLWTGSQLLLYCPGTRRRGEYGGSAFTIPAAHRTTSSAQVPKDTFVSLVPACACGRHTELEEFSDTNGAVLRHLGPIGVDNEHGQSLDTPASTADGDLLFTYTHGAQCKPGTSTMDGCELEPDTCRNTVERLLPGQKHSSVLFTEPADVAISEAVPNPSGSQVAFVATPCSALHGTTGLFLRDLRTGQTRAVFTTTNRCDGFTAPAWNPAGTSLAVGFFRARGGPSRMIGGVACPAAGKDELLVVSVVSKGGRPSAPMAPGRGCQFYAVAFDAAGPVAADGCSHGSPHGFSSSNLGDAYLVQYDSATRHASARLALQRGMEGAVVDTIPGTGSVLVTQDQPANNGTPEDDWVWSFDGRHLRPIAHYKADDAAEVLAVPW